MNRDPKKYAMLHLRILRYRVGSLGRCDSRFHHDDRPLPPRGCWPCWSGSASETLGDAKEVDSVSDDDDDESTTEREREEEASSPVSKLDLPSPSSCAPPSTDGIKSSR